MATVIIATYICSIFSKPTWESCVPVFWMLQFYNCCQGQKIKVKDDRMAKNQYGIKEPYNLTHFVPHSNLQKQFAEIRETIHIQDDKNVQGTMNCDGEI